MSTVSSRGRVRAAASLLAVACTTALSACGGEAADESAAVSSQEVTVTHAQGETTVPVNPETVITLDLASLDTLDQLGVQVDGLPKGSTLPPDFAAFASDEYLDAGTLQEPDYEAIAAADPDLIIVAGRSAATLPQLSEIAPTIDLSTDATDFLGSVRGNAETLGRIFGKEAEAESLLATLDSDIEATREAAADAGTGLIVMTNGGEVTAYGPGSRFGFLHDVLGLTPAVEDVEAATHGEAVSFEFIAEANPDWLFVVDRDAAIGSGGAAAAQVLDNPLVAGTTAWSSDQVVYVDSADWYITSGGLGTLDQILDQVTSALA